MEVFWHTSANSHKQITKIIIKIDATRVISANKFKIEVESSHADFLLPEAKRWLKTGINETASAPDVKMKNMKSGIVKAAV